MAPITAIMTSTPPSDRITWRSLTPSKPPGNAAVRGPCRARGAHRLEAAPQRDRQLDLLDDVRGDRVRDDVHLAVDRDDERRLSAGLAAAVRGVALEQRDPVAV